MIARNRVAVFSMATSIGTGSWSPLRVSRSDARSMRPVPAMAFAAVEPLVHRRPKFVG